jgi:hypothetical protein
VQDTRLDKGCQNRPRVCIPHPRSSTGCHLMSSPAVTAVPHTHINKVIHHPLLPAGLPVYGRTAGAGC